MAILAFVAIGGVGVVIAALLGAFSSDLGMYGEIFVVNPDGRGLRQLTHDQRFHSYAWSPDGRWIAAATRSVDAHGIEMPGPLELFERAASCSCGAWSAFPSWSATRSAYIPFNPQAANLMFMLVSHRYERASLIITSNKPFSAWGGIFGDDAVAVAMVDRLVHHAEILSLKGDSYRRASRYYIVEESPAADRTGGSARDIVAAAVRLVHRMAYFVVLPACTLAAAIVPRLAVAHRPSCLPHGAETITEDRSVRIYRLPPYVEGVRTRQGTYACLRHSGTTTSLADRLPEGHGLYLPLQLRHFALAGPVVAYARSYVKVDVGCTGLTSLSLATGRTLLDVSNVACFGIAQGSSLLSVVVNLHGAIAWTVSAWTRSGLGRSQVWRSSRAGATTLLDEGSGLAAGSLSLAPGGEVSWTNGGQMRFATLP
jgi:IstB-like ATP binding protein